MSEFSPATILVTGGAGFIGANFVRHLLAADPTVRIINLDLLTYAGFQDNLRDLPAEERHVFVQGDIRERSTIDQLLREYEVDSIVHFAAESHVDRSITGPAEFVSTNFVGTFTLLDAARVYWLEERGWDAEQCRFHHVSTDEVYGMLGAGDPPFTERTAYAPNSPYSASKAGSDHMVRAYFHTYGLPVVTTNCSNNYGPYQHPEKFIPTIIRSCVQSTPIPVYGDGSNIRDWLYVEDHCRALELVLRRGRLGETYNIGGDEEHSNLVLVREICTLMDELRPGQRPYAELVEFVADRPGHDWRYAIDSAKLQRELGWAPREGFREGLRKTVLWYLEHGFRSH